MKNSWVKFCAVLFFVLVTVSCKKGQTQSLSVPALESLYEVKMNLDFESISWSLRGLQASDVRNHPLRISFSDLRVVFYTCSEGGEPLKVAYVFDKDISYDGIEAKGSDLESSSFSEGLLTLQMSGMQVSAQDYKVLVIARPTRALRTRTEVGASFEELRKTLPLEIQPTGKFNDYFYSNSEELSTLKGADLFSQTSPSVIRAKLKSSCAYVSIDWVAQADQEGARVSDERLVVIRDVMNRKYAIYPEYETVTIQKEGVGPLEEKFPKDPNFSGLSSKSIEELSEEFFYLDPSENLTIKTFDHTTKKFPAVRLPENTMDGQDFSGRVITRVIVRIAYAPKSINLGDSWVRFAGKVYTPSQFKQDYEALLTKASGERTAREQEMVKVGDWLRRENPESFFPTEGVTHGAFEYFYRGECYYAIPIRHYTDAQLSTRRATGRYGVVRNTLYMIRISKFPRPGKATASALDRDVSYDDLVRADAGLSFVAPNIVEYEVEL